MTAPYARYDVSGVAPQGGYPAKQCPVRAQWDFLRPAEPLAKPADLRRRFARGRQFEADIVARMLPYHPRARLIADGERAERDWLDGPASDCPPVAGLGT